MPGPLFCSDMCSVGMALDYADFRPPPAPAFGGKVRSASARKSTSALVRGCSWSDRGSSPEPMPGSEEEVKWLRRQNAKLKSRLQQGRPGGDDVGRRARDEASLVMRHEEQLRRVAAQYEQQLSALREPRPRSLGGSGRLGSGGQDESRRHLEAARKQADDAEAVREAAETLSREAEAQAAKYKRKMQKMKSRTAEEVRGARDRLRCVASAGLARGATSCARMVLALWHQVASRLRDQLAADRAKFQALEAHASGAQTVEQRVLAMVASRPLLLLMSTIRGWAGVAMSSRHQMELRVQLDEASMQSTSAIQNARMDVRVLRIRVRNSGRWAANSRALMSLASPMAIWAQAVQKAKMERNTAAIVAAAPASPMPASEVDRACAPHQQPGLRGDAAAAVFRTSAAFAAVSGGCRRLSLLAVLHAWGARCLERRREADLHAQIDDSSMRSMNAIATLRADVRELRSRGFKSAHRAAASRARLALSSAFGAWTRATLISRLQGSCGDDIKLAKQNPDEMSLQPLRSLHSPSKSTRAIPSKLEALVDRQSQFIEGERGSAVMFAAFRAWAADSAAEHSRVAIQGARQSLEDAMAKHKIELECARNASSASLRQSWDSANEAKRQLAALDRRRENWEVEREALQSRAGSRPSTAEPRPATSGGGQKRPTTAAGIEQMLRERREAGEAAASASTAGPAEVLILDGAATDPGSRAAAVQRTGA